MRSIWDKYWSAQSREILRYRKALEAEVASLRWRKVEREILNQKKTFEGLKVIELGSGIGTASLIMRLKGADVTLVDFSTVALEKARSLFKLFGCDAKFLLSDCLNLPVELIDKFDISISLGLAEHFIGSQRQEIFKSHSLVLADKGISFISVPNKFCLPYRIWKKYLELRRAWVYGAEVPYSRSELIRLASQAGFVSFKIFGSSFINSFDSFLFFHLMSRLRIKTEIPSFLDNFFGYALVLVGYKSTGISRGVS